MLFFAAQVAGADYGADVGEGAFDGVCIVKGSGFEALAQGFDGWGQDEDGAGGRVEFADLLGSLPVYFEDYVEALLALLLHPFPRGAVVVAVDFGVFEEGVFRQLAFELVAVDEEIVDAVAFSLASRAGRVGKGR